MSSFEGGSVPPPGWSEGQGAPTYVPMTAVPAVAAPPAPSLSDADAALWPTDALAKAVASSTQPAAEAAVRWRVRAATVDNLIVYGLYLALCLILHWQVATVGHVLVLLALGVVYHFVLESNGGQTIGKRRYGIQVVHVNGGPATPKGIALRSVLRAIDALPFWYLSGLISMVRTGPERRQRIGDVAGETKVVAVGGRALNRGTPGWLLPTATLAAFAVSVISIYAIAEAGRQPLSSTQQAQFVAGCSNASGGAVDCQCVLSHLEAAGYDSVDSINGLEQAAQSERASGQQGSAERELVSIALVCRQ